MFIATLKSPFKDIGRFEKNNGRNTKLKKFCKPRMYMQSSHLIKVITTYYMLLLCLLIDGLFLRNTAFSKIF